MVRHKKVGDNAEEGEDLKMLEVDEIIALLKLDEMELDLEYFVSDRMHAAYIRQPYNPGTRTSISCMGTGDTDKKAANNAWRKYVDERGDNSPA